MAHHPFPWTEAFLASLREVPVVTRACEVVGIERSTAYRRREADETFAAAWDDAMEAGIDRAEQEAFRRAVDGYHEPLTHQGHITYHVKRDKHGRPVLDEHGLPVPLVDESGQPVPLTVRKHSDALLSLILKGRRKKVYADRTELTGADGGPMVQQVDDTTRSARVAQLMALAEARKAGAAGDDINDLV
jgi:hypothetical protein